jgi:hypothetical protein
MAEYMTPEEMTAAYSAAKKQEADDLKQFGYVTTSTKNALKDAETGIRDYTQNLKTSLNSLKGSLWKTVGSMAEGAKGASQYNDAISEGADYLTRYLSGKGPFGKAAAVIIKAGAMYVTAVNKQADALFKGYQDISRTGATGAGGVTELYANMQKFGYGIAELGELSSLLKENSQSLAAMSGTVLDGTQTFGNISRGIRDSEVGDRFLNLGISVDQMNKGIAGYLRIQTLTGQAQLQTQAELQRGAEEYILQQERLTKLTGLNADEQNKILEGRDISAVGIDNAFQVLDQMKAPDFDTPITRGDLEIQFQPIHYDVQHAINQQQFEQQRKVQMIPGSELPEEQKLAMLAEAIQRITEITIDALKYSVASIRTPSAIVTESEHISEFLTNCDRQLFTEIKDRVVGMRKATELKPLHFTCGECQHEYDQPLTLDMASFFASAS